MKFPSLTYRIAAWFVLASLLPIMLIGAGLMFRFETEMRRAAINHVSDIADIKLDDINSYLNERLRDIAVLTQDDTVLQATREFEKAFTQSGVTSDAYRRLDVRYRRHFMNFAKISGYYDVFLISPQGRVVYTNAHETDFTSNLLTGPYRNTGLGRITRQALTTLQSAISDFDYYAPSGGKIAAFIAAPLVRDGRIEGVVALQINNDRIWAVLADNNGLGVGSETVVTRIENEHTALVMAPLNAEPDATLKRRIPLAITATRLGLLGQRGSGITVDYRGKPVVAAWRYLPRMGWGMVVKTDVPEALAPVFRMRLIAGVISGLTLLFAVLAAFLLGRGIVDPLNKLSRAAEGLAAGNFDARVMAQGRDEVARLGRSFNSMASALAVLVAGQKQAQKDLREINESLEHRVAERTATLTEVAAQLKREREFAETLVNAAPAIVLVLSSEGKIQLVNRYFENLTGYNVDEIHGKDWFDSFLPVRERKSIRSLFKKAAQGSPTRGNINSIMTRSGEERLIEWSDALISSGDGQKASVLAIGVDITDSNALEQAVLMAAQYNQSLLRLTKEIETAQTAAEVIAALSQEISETLGYGQTWIAFAGNHQAASLTESLMLDIKNDPFLESLAAAGQIAVVEDMQSDPRVDEKHTAIPGCRTLVHLPLFLTGRRGSLLTGTFGDEKMRPPTPAEIDYLVAVTHHVAVALDRIEVTRILSLREAQLNEAQHMARVGSWHLDLTSGKLGWSDEIYRIFEIDQEKFGASYEAFIAAIHPDDRELVDQAYKASVASRIPYQITHRLLMPDGRVKWVEERCQTLYDESGNPLHSTGTVQDVTERVEITNVLHLREAQLSEAQRVARMGSVESDLVSGAFYFSDQAYDIFELNKEQHGGDPFAASYAVIHPEDRDGADKAYLSSLENRLPLQYTYRLLMPDGRIKWIEHRVQNWYDDSGKPLRSTGTVQDITERMEFTEALSHRETQLNEAQRMARMGSWDLNFISNELKLSDETYQILEMRREDFDGSLESAFPHIHPEDQEKVRKAFDGAIANGTSYHLAYRLQIPDGGIKWVEGRCSIWYDETDKPLRATGTVQDITERVAAEEELRRSLAEKETLLREIHHRVKNNLQIISSLLYFQAKKVKNPDDLAVMTDSRDRLRAMILVHETLYQSNDLNRVSFGEYLQTLTSQLADAHAARARGIAVHIEADDYALPIETALPCGMIICELLINAFKYAFPDGRKGEVAVIIKVKNGQVEISVNDNGVGLPKDFSTETTEFFGWQLINSLVVQIGGTISIRRDLGTKVKITFPYIKVSQ
jgi:PAS domain S-box-containing protein